MTLALLVVGSPAVLTDPNHPPRRVKIARVGRKYLYTSNLDVGYDRETGMRADAWRSGKLWTVEEYEEHRAREEAQDQLRSWGVQLSGPPRLRAVEIRDALRSLLAPPPIGTGEPR